MHTSHTHMGEFTSYSYVLLSTDRKAEFVYTGVDVSLTSLPHPSLCAQPPLGGACARTCSSHTEEEETAAAAVVVVREPDMARFSRCSSKGGAVRGASI